MKKKAILMIMLFLVLSLILGSAPDKVMSQESELGFEKEESDQQITSYPACPVPGGSQISCVQEGKHYEPCNSSHNTCPWGYEGSRWTHYWKRVCHPRWGWCESWQKNGQSNCQWVGCDANDYCGPCQ
jgi:hypothetical protein